MKKIIFIAISALTALLVSCNMDKLPYTAIEESQGIMSMNDATQLRVSIYTPVKGLWTGARVDVDEIRGGLFNATADFGNYYGAYYIWNMQTTESEVESVWYSDYGVVGSMNYAIGAYEKLLANENAGLADADKATLSNYIAEAYFTRALAYWDLVTKFCVAYDPATAKEELGLPLQTVYAPTSESSKYPGRSSLEDTYQLILSDLNKAMEITTAGIANSNYYTKDVVLAMMARVQLNMKDYANAANNAQEVINSNKYTLGNSAADVESLYVADTSNEVLMLVPCNVQDLPGSIGTYYIYDQTVGDGSGADPQYIPSKTMLDLYDTENDWRYPVFFRTMDINIEGVGKNPLTLMWKFAGNPTLRTSAALNYRNAPKPFRIAEMYLTLAEAAIMLGEANLSTARNALNALRAARIEGYADESYVARDIMGIVKAEWTREYVGEGFRMINMKRWGDNIVRGVSQNSAMTRQGEQYDGLEREITHARCVWPIPKVEIDANPQIKDQQNPGY